MPETSNARAPQTRLPDRASRRWRRLAGRLVALGLAVTVVGATAIWTDVAGAGDRWQSVIDRVDRFVAGPVPTRPSVPTVIVTPRPTLTTSRPDPSDPPTTPGAEPSRTPSPTPARVAVDVNILPNPERVFASQITKNWCAPATTQMVLTIFGRGNPSEAFQRELVSRIGEWESWQDSHDGGWGPSAMVEALVAYGVSGYEIRAYETRPDALRDAASAISATGSPVILLAWRGAHAWVMSGYRADADPRLFPDATVTGAYILDAWYPRVSSIWGPSDPPGTFQDSAEMARNFLPWKRPEGKYPERDGRFIVLIPTLPLDPSR
ncbi:MAG: C39 family peptidase [Chloroflexi bacterium]|nr:C39 family peptidase [Chloroflexota bacterium]